ncbi:MAG: hypothetical protein Q8R36_01980 [bacterium]|nr:hypothetical protein [bacterium]
MKFLIFGFKPYRNYTENITEKVIRKLKQKKNLRTTVFPVMFDRKMFSHAIHAYKPDVVIGLGQHPRARKIRIERRAVNHKRAFQYEKLRNIENGGPRHRFVTLKLKPDRHARVAYDAGDYVCNFCMYTISEIARKKHIKFAFLHIPKNYNLKRIVRFIETKIKENIE